MSGLQQNKNITLIQEGLGGALAQPFPALLDEEYERWHTSRPCARALSQDRVVIIR